MSIAGGTHEIVEVLSRLNLGTLVQSPRFVARGAMGEIFRVDTDQGTWAVKALFEWDPTSARPPDVDVQVAAIDAGIAMPHPVLSEDGDAVIAIDDARFRVYEWVDLDQPAPVPASPHHARRAGEILGVIHNLNVESVGDVDDWYLTPPDRGRWVDLIAASRAAGEDWANQLHDHVGMLDDMALFAAAAAHQPPRMCHRDFNPSNVLPDRNGQLVTLDWENAGPLEPAAEIASSLIDWSTSPGVIDPETARVFLGGYNALANKPVALTTGSFAVAVATFLNFLAVMCDQALHDPAHRDFARSNVHKMLGGGAVHLRTAIQALTQALELDGPTVP